MQYKRLRFETKAIDADQGIFEGYASVFGVVDYENDMVEKGAFARSINEGLAKDGIKILVEHDDSAPPVGKSLELKEDSKGLYIKGYIAPTSTGKDCRQLIKDGIITHMSIGYIDNGSVTDENGVRHLKELELAEVSLVANPANSQASISGYKNINNNEGGHKTMSKALSDISVDDFQTAIAKAVASGVKEAMSSDEGAEKDPLAKDLGVDADEEEEREEERKSYARGRSEIQRKYASIYMPMGQGSKETKALPKGIGWVRFQKCMGQAHGDLDRAAHIAHKMYDDPRLVREIKALSVTSPSSGGFLVPAMYADEVIPMLYAQAVVTKLGATVVSMPNGNLRMPRMNSGAVASYTGELRTSKKSQPSFEEIILSAKKLTAKIPISNDLLRSNSYSADKVILDDAIRQMALAMDKAALMGKGTNFEPLGLFNMKGIPHINLAALPDEKTSGQLLAELIRGNADTTKLGWAFGADVWQAFYNLVNGLGLYIYRPQMDQGLLNGHEFAISTQLTADDTANRKANIVLGNWKEFIIGEQLRMESEFFKEGSITDDDGKMLSALDNDITILRIISTHDFGVRHEQSFVIADDVHTT